ncbi:hypothetical protein GGI1_10158, partial [Acidithiobacillus sp. GGI-221]
LLWPGGVSGRENLSMFAFVRQERYVGNGNALTSRDAGLGLEAKFS